MRKTFPGLALWGAEIYKSGLDIIKGNIPNIHLIHADVCRIPFFEEFDVIGAFDVLEHINQDDRVLKEMFKATKPNGGIMISVPQHPYLWSQRDIYLCHKRRYTRTQLVRLVKNAGFKVVYLTSFNTLPFPFMVFRAIKNRKPKPQYDPFAELKIGKVKSAILNLLFFYERVFIKMGFSFPFGGSLFLIAKR